MGTFWMHSRVHENMISPTKQQQCLAATAETGGRSTGRNHAVACLTIPSHFRVVDLILGTRFLGPKRTCMCTVRRGMGNADTAVR